ncbi:barstar family protein [Micromonospora sp. NPDC048909]|uniref:barstar family protein n=1 Tax=Micromonospora sp. NPDC048909 TaxID=3155643 RepID=UPI0033D3838C
MSMWDRDHGRVRVVDSETRYRTADLLPPAGTVVVAHVDGADMGDEDEVFTQFYHAFELPNYFGWNWPALSDCLRDLDWLPANRYILSISNADLALSQNPGLRGIFLQLLNTVSTHWAGPGNYRGGQPVVFDVLLICAGAAVSRLESELQSLNRQG